MSTYTHAQIRAAIYRAADKIERDPSCYNFGRFETPRGECGTVACMWGWIGFYLGLPTGTDNIKVANACGITEAPKGRLNNTGHLYVFCQDIHNDVPRQLRAYADRYFPAEVAPLDTAYLSFRAALLCAPLRLTHQREHVVTP